KSIKPSAITRPPASAAGPGLSTIPSTRAPKAALPSTRTAKSNGNTDSRLFIAFCAQQKPIIAQELRNPERRTGSAHSKSKSSRRNRENLREDRVQRTAKASHRAGTEKCWEKIGFGAQQKPIIAQELRNPERRSGSALSKSKSSRRN